MIFAADESAHRAVLDWELATLVVPVCRFSYHCNELAHCTGAISRHRADLITRHWGIPRESRIHRRYCQRTCRARIDHWNFYLAYNLFRSRRSCRVY